MRDGSELTVGADSLQGQFFKHLRDAVFPAATLYHVTHTDFVIRGTMHRVPAFKTLSLASSAPLSRELARRAGAPIERLGRPIITFVRDDLLLSAEETAGLVAGILRSMLGAKGRSTNIVYGNWTQHVERALRPVRLSGGDEWEGDRPTALWLNTGGHWSPRSFLDFDETNMLEAYRQGVRAFHHPAKIFSLKFFISQFITIMAAVRTLPRTLPIYRPSIPGHAHCTAFRSPVASASELRPLIYSENFGWNLFTIYNDILVAELLRAEEGESSSAAPAALSDSDVYRRQWEEVDDIELEDDVSTSSAGLPQGRPSLEGPRPKGYMPVFQRSLLRPEYVSVVCSVHPLSLTASWLRLGSAHRVVLDAFGNPDCLHIAGPSVLEEWLKWAWKELSDLERDL